MKSGAEILKQRAEALAKKESTGIAKGDLLDAALFNLAHEIHAIELEYVKEVYPPKDLTPIPHTPAFIKGVIHYRGQILSVVDLRVLFDLPRQPVSDANRVIVLASEEMSFGVLADSMREVARIAKDTLQPTLATLTAIRAKYLKGVTLDGIVVLDGGKLLNDPQMVIK